MYRACVARCTLHSSRLASAQQIEIGPGGVRVEPPHSGGCRELREACIHKEELGEQGEGNCRRYRETCREHFWRYVRPVLSTWVGAEPLTRARGGISIISWSC